MTNLSFEVAAILVAIPALLTILYSQAPPHGYASIREGRLGAKSSLLSSVAMSHRPMVPSLAALPNLSGAAKHTTYGPSLSAVVAATTRAPEPAPRTQADTTIGITPLSGAVANALTSTSTPILQLHTDMATAAPKPQTSAVVVLAGATSPAASFQTQIGSTSSTAACTTRQYKVPTEALLSTGGKMWEHYHMMVDFAPPIYFRLAAEITSLRCGPVVLNVPGWYPDCRFCVKYGQRDQSELFDWIFQKGLQLVFVTKKADYEMLNATRIEWNPHTSPWSSHPRQVFRFFREGQWSQAGISFKPGKGAPILIQREYVPCKGKACNDHRTPANGAARRKLPLPFFVEATEDLRNVSVPLLVRQLHGLSLREQVRTFANTSVMIGMHGAGLSNAMFLPDSSLLFEIGWRFYPAYSNMALNMGLPYAHLKEVKCRKASATDTDRKCSGWTLGMSLLVRDFYLGAGHMSCPVGLKCFNLP
eukprot:TRINITY_DN75223_c0_g1_i1.p1 TRINITY_DN75223_c0_g1~~TRINITY_DN75223_c0_g1_i1.p1  ORF type:complete len:476 (+),score=34.96 TRINITY_DN75223_c0_g1_i1:200-1627(+)